MRKLKFLILSCGIIVCGKDEVFAESGLDFELRADYLGKYIWRGQNLTDDPVFQMGISASHKGLTASIWGNLELTNINENSGNFTEIDYSLDYYGKVPGIERLAYSFGAIYYDFPGTKTKDTTEAYWGLNADLPLRPSLTFYHDLDEANGTYFSFGLGHSIEKIANLQPDTPITMEIGASLGWGSASYNKYYWRTNQSKLNDLAFSISFPMEIAGWTLAPSVNYVTLLSDDIRHSDVYGTDSDFFFAGVSLLKRF